MSNITVPQSICIIRLSAIGDCINVIPLVQLIQKTYPQVKITWITEKIDADLLNFMSGIDFITYNKKKGLKELQRLKKILKTRHFDYLLHLQSAIKASIIAHFVKAETKIGFCKERSKDLQWMFINKKIPSPRGSHVVDGFMEFAYAIGCPREVPVWNITTDQTALDKFKKIISLNRPLCLINPCTSKESKNWTIEGYIEICNYMIDKGFNVYLIGGNSKTEQIYNHEIINAARNGVDSLIGKTTINELLAVISMASIVISADTAAVHMANALNIPVVGLYATHNPERVGPYNQPQNAVSVYETCVEKEYGKPSSMLPWRTRVHNPEAMKLITPSMVQSAVDKVCKDWNL